MATDLKPVSNKEFDEPPKISYPKRVFLIIGNEFCERFNYYGIKTVLSLYLNSKLGFTEDDATVLFHAFAMTVNFMCIFGGIISDVWLGKFKTILYLSIVYAFGSTIVSISSIEMLHISPKVVLIIGLVFVAIGSGGIKPCVSSFGGDQFKLPQQTKQLATFFSLFYFSINSGSLISTTITPILRADVHCFTDNECFPLAFGVPAFLMITSLVFFLSGKASYTYVNSSSENMLVKVSRCITNAITTKFREGRTNPRENLLDYSVEKYGEELISDIRALMSIVILYLPLPIFWSLYDQKGSRWTFQAKKMNGDLGFYTIKPDQIQMLNPFLLFIFIPTFETVIYPLLAKIGIKKTLQKMVIGGLFAAIAFTFSALVQFTIDSSPEQSVNMLWLLPQYTAISVAEIMFSVNGIAFSYEQAPKRMKSVVMAFWLLTVSFGNLILIAIAKSKLFHSQAHEFLLFSGLMFVDMLIFGILAHNFKTRSHTESNTEENQLTDFKIPRKSLKEIA